MVHKPAGPISRPGRQMARLAYMGDTVRILKRAIKKVADGEMFRLFSRSV